MSVYTVETLSQQIAEVTKALAVIGEYKLGVKQTEALHHAERVLNATSLMLEAIAVSESTDEAVKLAVCQIKDGGEPIDAAVTVACDIFPKANKAAVLKAASEACDTAEVKTEEASPTPVKRTEKVYTIKVSGYHAGSHSVRVVSDIDGSKYVSGHPFGCSRNYYVSTDREAINRLMAEHGCKLVSME